jgi:hypothetical protein
MSNKGFLKKIVSKNIIGNVYARNIPDIYEFMNRTNTGFWTWTMIYHFSNQSTFKFKNRNQVLEEAHNISKNIKFIHQENIDKDVEKILKINRKRGEKINVSPRPARILQSDEIKKIIHKLDGDIAYILCGYKY